MGLKWRWLELSGYKENLSFLKDSEAEIYSCELNIDLMFMGLTVNYSPNYPIAGIVSYTESYTINKQNYVSVGLHWIFNIAKEY